MVVLVIGIPSPTVTGMKAFSSFAVKYVMDDKKTLQVSTIDVNILLVIASEDFTPQVIEWVSETRPEGKTLTDRFEFPVLVSTKTGEVYCFRETPFNAGLHIRVLRKRAANYIGFSSPTGYYYAP